MKKSLESKVVPLNRHQLTEQIKTQSKQFTKHRNTTVDLQLPIIEKKYVLRELLSNKYNYPPEYIQALVYGESTEEQKVRYGLDSSIEAFQNFNYPWRKQIPAKKLLNSKFKLS